MSNNIKLKDYGIEAEYTEETALKNLDKYIAMCKIKNSEKAKAFNQENCAYYERFQETISKNDDEFIGHTAMHFFKKGVDFAEGKLTSEIEKLSEGLDHYVNEACVWKSAATKHYFDLLEIQKLLKELRVRIEK